MNDSESQHQSAHRSYPYPIRRMMQALRRHSDCVSVERLQDELALFVPNSGGPRGVSRDLTMLSISQTFPLLAELATQTKADRLRRLDAEEFCDAPAQKTAENLAALFKKYGSDKSGFHNYHLVYGKIIHSLGEFQSMLEIGMGTNDVSVISNMGAAGKPGASLRAFRDLDPAVRVYGADIDRNILFREERIESYFVDQTDSATLEHIASQIPGALDLVIDDGLHAPNANLAVMLFAMKKIRQGGWFVIEDIPERALPVWEVVAALLPEEYETWAVRCRSAYVFAGKKH